MNPTVYIHTHTHTYWHHSVWCVAAWIQFSIHTVQRVMMFKIAPIIWQETHNHILLIIWESRFSAYYIMQTFSLKNAVCDPAFFSLFRFSSQTNCHLICECKSFKCLSNMAHRLQLLLIIVYKSAHDQILIILIIEIWNQFHEEKPLNYLILAEWICLNIWLKS